MEDTIPAMTCPICSARAEDFGAKAGFRLARCNSCGTIFVIDPPSDTSAFYSEAYFWGGNAAGGYTDYDAEKEAMRSTFIRALERIEAAHAKGSMLDVGAASGFFLALARERGWRVEGIDIAPSARDAAAKKGIEVKTGVLAPDTYPGESFDTVTAFDVLEHVSNPKALLAAIHASLAPSGILFGSTPDTSSVYARVMGKNWHLLCPPEHLTLFSERSLRQALLDSGFEVVWTGRIGKRFTPPYIFQTASRWLGISLLGTIANGLASTPFARLSIPLDLRDNIFFLARRI